ncbi:phosphoglycerate mutase (plasmid) [Frondihabitans sp. PAMC 28766]|uniref:histidine phosphatase family protein n=1 Tax=Frondihabitans sp. PAMC 28766 TaxID=1795630 RepID=UPI00078CD0BB|nr:histidine phosphatase family protein [Frondihabitans sp. PAMC 28766]AMM22681.1 phosphoglycerate mutase [Frondihabitans sp. PAMC 28766]
MNTPGTVCVYFVRHGETNWSLTGQHTGRTDIPLTGPGREQVTSTRRLLEGIAFTAAFSSPMLRARQTGTLSMVHPSPVIDPDLSEWDYGAFEGRTTPDIRRDDPGWNVFRDGCPDGETTSDVADRADRLIDRLRLLRGNVALFSHGQFGSALAARWIGLPLAQGQHFPLGAASVSVLGYEPGHPEVPVISLWNDTTPLAPQ